MLPHQRNQRSQRWLNRLFVNLFTPTVLSGVFLTACYSESNELSPAGLGAGSVASRTASKGSEPITVPPVTPIQQSQYDREEHVPAKTLKEAFALCEKLAERLKRQEGKTYITWNVQKGLMGGYVCQFNEVKQ